MKFSASLIAVCATTCVSALTRCGTTNPPQSYLLALEEDESLNATSRGGRTRTIDTYAHVVTTQEKEGMYSDAIIAQQIEVMNSEYGPSGFQFNLLSTDFTVNDRWAAAGQQTQAELRMKRALHQGSYSDLNLYFLSDLGGGLLGFCYFPTENPTAQDVILDGCVNLAGSLPGADELLDYNLGYTAVHETGHWLGLFHVFQGGSCTGRGDYIPDTAVQSTPTDGCPARKNSCPSVAGPDNIHNFMDYSYDECMYEFTLRQGERAIAVFDQYRAGK